MLDYRLQVLREVHNCSLPIELVWHSPTEMDPTTLSVLQAQWGPIRGVDLSQKPWPDHHRWPAALDFTGETVNQRIPPPQYLVWVTPNTSPPTRKTCAS
jgi:hypothetical protein